MTLACPVDLDSLRLRREVQDMYARVAAAPDGSFHFHRGPEYAIGWLGYDATELSELPKVTHAFAGVGNPHAVAPLPSGAREDGLSHVDVLEGDATNLPLDDASVDVVMSNGVLNLVPEKERAFAEIARVLRRGGRLQIADIVTGVELSEAIRRDIELWTG
jgi:SAM-dependent methyltransferase